MEEKEVYPATLEPAIRSLRPLAMATAWVRLLLLGVLFPLWGEFLLFKQWHQKKEGSRCSHHSQCFSDCCLMNLDFGGNFCAPKTRKAMPCLPQTKGAINILCPCRVGLNCISRDLNCPRRCYLM